MKKIILIIITCIGISLFQSVVTFAEDDSARLEDKKIIPYTEENVAKFEKNTFNNHIPKDSTIDSYAITVDPGAFRISYSNRRTSGYIYQDATKQATSLSIIKDVVLTISGYFTSTVFNIITDTAKLVYSYKPTQIAISKPGSATLYHSYSYVNKRGDVYTGSYWKTCVEIQRREWYKHSYTSFATTSGITRTASYDYTPENGYKPIKTEYAKYYSDDNMIKNMARDVWAYNKAIVRFGWSF